MKREEVLHHASDVVMQRGENYGSPYDNFINIAKLWSAYTGRRFNVEEIGVMLMLLKVARSKHNQYHYDNWVDIAGYAAVTSEALYEIDTGGSNEETSHHSGDF